MIHMTLKRTIHTNAHALQYFLVCVSLTFSCYYEILWGSFGCFIEPGAKSGCRGVVRNGTKYEYTLGRN